MTFHLSDGYHLVQYLNQGAFEVKPPVRITFAGEELPENISV